MSSNVTIGNLTALSTVSDSTVFAGEDGGFTRKISAAVIKNYMSTTTTIVASGPINAGGGLTANSIRAGVIGNTGAILTGTISTATQPNITSVGTLTSLTSTGIINTTSHGVFGGNLTIGTTIQSRANLFLYGGVLNSTIGSSIPLAEFQSLNNNASYLRIVNNRHAAGSDWTTANTRIQQRTDITDQGYVEFNPIGAVAGVAIGSGSTEIIRFAPGGNVVINSTTGSISNTTGALIVKGGIGVAGAVNAVALGGTLSTPAQPNVTSVGTLSSLAVGAGGASVAGTLSATTLTGTLSTAAQPNVTSLGTLTGLTLGGAVVPSANVTYNLGSPTAWWNMVYGKSVQAQYADLAENYSAAQGYAPGTVVVWSTGLAEIETSDESHSPRVAGIISTDPAYLMNAATAGLPVALAGRVPCKVRGPVSKSDRLVNIEAGVAGRLDMSKFTPGCVLGYALESVPDGELATIEVVITRF